MDSKVTYAAFASVLDGLKHDEWWWGGIGGLIGSYMALTRIISHTLTRMDPLDMTDSYMVFDKMGPRTEVVFFNGLKKFNLHN